MIGCYGVGDNILARLLPGAGLVHALAVHVVVRAARLVVLNIYVEKKVNFLGPCNKACRTEHFRMKKVNFVGRKAGNAMAKNSLNSDRCSDG